MKGGLHDFHFLALGTDLAGEVTVKGHLVDGGDAVHAVRGLLSRAGTNLLATFAVHWRAPPRAWGTRAALPNDTIQVFGSGSDTEFSVIGRQP